MDQEGWSVWCDFTACWWLALAIRQISEDVCWWAQNHSVFGGSLWREGSYRKRCVWWEQNHTVLVVLFVERAVI